MAVCERLLEEGQRSAQRALAVRTVRSRFPCGIAFIHAWHCRRAAMTIGGAVVTARWRDLP